MTARLVIAALLGAMLSAAFEPIAIPYVVPVALAGFALVTANLPVRRSGLIGFVFGLAFYLLHIDWMISAVGLVAWAGLGLLVSLSYAGVGLAAPLLRRLPGWPVWLAVVWTAAENLRSTWPFGGMPWGRLGFAVVDTPVAPTVAYLGTSLLGLSLALLGFLAARSIEERSLGWCGATIGVAALLMVPAVAPYHFHADGHLTVAAVQGDVPGGDDMLGDPRAITRNELAGTQRLAAEVATGRRQRPAFVLWPENSTVVDLFYDPDVNRYVSQAVEAAGVPIVVGGVVQQGEKHMLNQGIVWDPVTGPGDRYTKAHPVPFGEYIPFRDVWHPRFGRLALVPRDIVAGTRTTPLRVAGTRLGDAICFDVAYDEVLREQVGNGAEMLAVQTSNATFIHTHQIDQQFAITRLRAIESGRWLVLASTNGLSGVIAPDGTVVATAPRRTRAILEEQVGLSSQITPAVRMGAWPTRTLSALAVLVLVLGALAYRRGRGGTTGERRAARPRRAAALRRVHRDAAGGAVRDHQGGQLDRRAADDRPASPGQPDRDLADQA